MGFPRLKTGVGVFCFVLALTRAPVAHAEPSASEKETARDLMEQGRTRLDEHNPKGALESFKAADAIMHVPTTGFMVASTQSDLGQLVEARETLAGLLLLLRTTQVPNEPEPFKRARKSAAELDEKLAARIPALKFDLETGGNAEAVAISVDDVPVSSSVVAVLYRVNPGHHTVVAKAGRRTASQEVDLREAETKTVALRFPTAAEAAAPAPIVPAEQPTEEKHEQKRVLTYAGFGVAGAGIVVGTITGLLMFSKRSDLDDGCIDKQCPPSMHDTFTSAHTMATISTISFVIAGVGAAVGVYGLVSGRSPRRATGSALPWLLRGAF